MPKGEERDCTHGIDRQQSIDDTVVQLFRRPFSGAIDCQDFASLLIERQPNSKGRSERSMNMGTQVVSLTKRPKNKRMAWSALASHYKTVSKLHLRELFADDAKRGERLALEAVGLYLDYSKNRITDETLKLLLELAEESGLRARIDAMFRGEKINITEKRAVLHVALRAPRDASIVVDGKNVVPEVHAVLD
ncbi:MAG TPA: hypothetical protein VMD76_08660, partial [Candidatus Sulfotelmatobacter sp.]|nr:hypothetical protein [Candidatus Sulfotelmatobacter sp.]